MTTKTLLAATFALLLAACGATTSSGGRVSIQADLTSMATQGSVVVKVSASPAGTSSDLTFDAETGRYAGSMSLPPGLQTLTVEALSDTDDDGELEVVAIGSGQASVVENQTASVVVVLMDLTPPPPVPDHRPIVTSAGVSNANPAPGETVSVWVSAVDVDEDPITFLWTVNCNSGSATIADPTAASTTFTVDTAATCSVNASASANGKTVWVNMAVQVGGSGQADVTISFATPPVIAQVYVLDTTSTFACAIDRTGDEATCADPLAMGAVADIYLTLDAASDGSQASVDVCGGLVTTVYQGPGLAHFTWQVPQASGVCVVTGMTVRDGYMDAFPVAMLLQ